MSFNELNTVEYQVVHRMSGLDLNTGFKRLSLDKDMVLSGVINRLKI